MLDLSVGVAGVTGNIREMGEARTLERNLARALWIDPFILDGIHGTKIEKHLMRPNSPTSSSSGRDMGSSSRRDSMVGELIEHFQGRSKFARYRRSHFEDAALMFAKHGFDSWKLIFKIDGETSKFLREDLTKDGTAAIELSMINETPSHLEQEKHSQFPFKNEKKK